MGSVTQCNADSAALSVWVEVRGSHVSPGPLVRVVILLVSFIAMAR